MSENNQNTNNKIPIRDNGGDTSSSLSAFNSEIERARDNNRPITSPMQQSNYIGSGLPNKRADGLQDKRNSTMSQNIANAKKNQVEMAKQNMLGGNSKNSKTNVGDTLAKAAGAIANPKKAAFDALTGKNKNKADNKTNEGSNKDDSEKTLKEKEADQEAKNKESGVFSLELKKSTLIKLGLLCSACGFVIIFFIALLSTLADARAAGIIMGELVGNDKALVKDIAEALQEDEFGTSSLAVAMGNKNLDKYYERLSVLGNVFSSEVFNCTTAEECIKRPEFKYYLKVADISTRYKNKYGIRLNWVLLNATMFYSNVTEEETMERALNDYNEDDITNFDILMNLDWDYDYKKIPGYSYLDPRDFRYDLQILAKNMVTKTTYQSCTKCTTDAEGVTKCVVTKSRTDMDIEDQYLKKGQEYYLQCDSGETYSITSNYKHDEDKYDEFLLEYIENKYYREDVPGITEDGNTDMTPSPASGEYIFPLPSGATTCRSSAYGPRIHPITGKYNNHSGDDYPAAAGTPVYAVADGTVSAAGFDNSMGNYVIVDHAGGVKSIYMHSSKLYVSAGAKVKQGDVIMAVGTTGSSTGNHLHITFKLNNATVNPADYIGALKMCY